MNLLEFCLSEWFWTVSCKCLYVLPCLVSHLLGFLNKVHVYQMLDQQFWVLYDRVIVTDCILYFVLEHFKIGEEILLFKWGSLFNISGENRPLLILLLPHACSGRHCVTTCSFAGNRYLAVHIIVLFRFEGWGNATFLFIFVKLFQSAVFLNIFFLIFNDLISSDAET